MEINFQYAWIILDPISMVDFLSASLILLIEFSIGFGAFISIIGPIPLMSTLVLSQFLSMYKWKLTNKLLARWRQEGGGGNPAMEYQSIGSWGRGVG